MTPDPSTDADGDYAASENHATPTTPAATPLRTIPDDDTGPPHETTPDKPLLDLVGSSTSAVVAGTFFLVLAYRRDAYMLTFFVGSILNAVASKVLKRVLDQDRPDVPGTAIEEDGRERPNDKGMPSSHAMSLGFIGTYASVGLWDTLVSAGSVVGGGGSAGLILTATAVYGSLWTYVAVSLVYRVKSRLHTVKQVSVGLLFGITDAFIWNSLAHGTNLLVPSVNVMHTVSSYLLPEGSGTVIQCIVVPAVVGLLVVGSFERRLLGWWRKVKRR